MRIVPVVAALAVAAPAWADQSDALRAENSRLRDRVETLERENARLRALLPPAEVDGEPPLAVTEDADGSQLTKATVALTVMGGSRAAHELRLEHGSDGAQAVIASTFSGGIHRHVDALELEVDDVTHVLPVEDYDATRVTTGSPQRRRRLDHERVKVTLPADLLVAIADARSVGGRLGRVRFLVEARDQRTLVSFARAVTGDRSASTRP